jgi:hypothetical protein
MLRPGMDFFILCPPAGLEAEANGDGGRGASGAWVEHGRRCEGAAEENEKARRCEGATVPNNLHFSCFVVP